MREHVKLEPGDILHKVRSQINDTSEVVVSETSRKMALLSDGNKVWQNVYYGCVSTVGRPMKDCYYELPPKSD